MFVGIVAAIAFGLRDPYAFVGFVLALGARGRDLLRPRRFLARSLLAARSAIGLALAWLLLVPAYAVFGAEGAAAWGFLHFAIQGGLDLFGVLTPDATVEAADAPAAPA